MSNLKELKKISLEFRRLSSNLLGTEYETANINLYRFKEYIDNTPIIVRILQEKMNGQQIDFKECFPVVSNEYCHINVPKEEGKHIKAIYDLIDYIVSNDINLRSIAFLYYCSSSKFVDIIQNFLNLSVKPLINYIIDEISKEIILEEENNMSGLNITGIDNSTISVAYNSNQTVTSNISVNYNDITKTIEDIKGKLEKSQIDSEEKENLEDDLDVIKEQIEKSVEKPIRLKKAYSNIVAFLENSSGVVTKATALGLGIQKLIELVSPIRDKF